MLALFGVAATLQWVNPSGDGFVLRGAKTLEATASDPAGIGQMEFWKAGWRLGINTTSPYQQVLDTTRYPNRRIRLDICARDNLGNRTCGYSNDISGTIDNSVSGKVAWRATHECVCFTKWSQWGQSQARFFPAPEVRDPALDGVPRLEGTYALKLQVHEDDSQRGRIHAKVYKWWNYNASYPRFHSGRYVSNVYMDPNWHERASSWGVNLFQFKEQWNDAQGFHQEAQWWIAAGERGRMVTACVFYGQSVGQGALRYISIPCWNFPRGQWVKLAAVVNVGQSISFYQNGQLKGTANHTSTTPVGPYRQTPEKWVFGTGNYGDNVGYVYVDDARFVK
jgi:hypothetical protein